MDREKYMNVASAAAVFSSVFAGWELWAHNDVPAEMSAPESSAPQTTDMNPYLKWKKSR